MSFFVKVFGYDTNVLKMPKTFIWLLVSFNRHKNIISHYVHIMVTHDMVLKTRFIANIQYWIKIPKNNNIFRYMISDMINTYENIQIIYLHNNIISHHMHIIVIHAMLKTRFRANIQY